MVLISDEGFPRRVGRHGSKRSTGSIDQAACAARPAADVAHELQGRGRIRVRGPVDAILQNQILLGERLGLAVVPRRAERVRDVVRQAERDVRVAREAGGVPPRLAQEAERLGGVPAGEQEAGEVARRQERLGRVVDYFEPQLGHRGSKLIGLSASRGRGVRYEGLVRGANLCGGVSQISCSKLKPANTGFLRFFTQEVWI